jgi:hypothetical protein
MGKLRQCREQCTRQAGNERRRCRARRTSKKFNKIRPIVVEARVENGARRETQDRVRATTFLLGLKSYFGP